MSQLLKQKPAAVRPHGATRFASRAETVRIGLLGLGNIGQAIARQCRSNHAQISKSGPNLRIVSALVRDSQKERDADVRDVRTTASDEEFFRHRFDVVIEAIGGVEPARTLVEHFLQSGTPVVTANKALIASNGHELHAVARNHGTTLRFEASALAGVPFLGALSNRPLLQRVERISAILNGTSNFITTRMDTRNQSLLEALRDARDLGLAEPDPSRDINGRDAADKLVVILQTLGIRVETGDIDISGIDRLRPVDFKLAHALGGTIKQLATATVGADLQACIGPTWLPHNHSLALLRDSQCGVNLSGADIGELTFAGPGAGPDITAATILDDVAEVAAGAGSHYAVKTPQQERRPCTAPSTPWFLRIRLDEITADADDGARRLGEHGVFAHRIAECLDAAGTKHVGILTGATNPTTILRATRDIESKLHCHSIAHRAIAVSVNQQ